jgi:hypothetical protein
MTMRPIPFLLALALLAACRAEKPDWAEQNGGKALPGAACKEVEKAVDQLRKGQVDISDSGEATLPPAAWNGMTAGQHDQLVRTLAFHASCKSGSQSDAQTVVVHGDDGSELARRTVSTKVDANEILRD